MILGLSARGLCHGTRAVRAMTYLWVKAFYVVAVVA